MGTEESGSARGDNGTNIQTQYQGSGRRKHGGKASHDVKEALKNSFDPSGSYGVHCVAASTSTSHRPGATESRNVLDRDTSRHRCQGEVRRIGSQAMRRS